MRLDINDKNVFNKWRELYDDLSGDEQLEFCNDLEGKYPSQVCFTKDFYKEIFKKHPVSKVFEVGGWKGELAKYCINNKLYNNIWFNAEVCTNAVQKGFKHNLYWPHSPNFNWFKEDFNAFYPYSLFLSSHTIEHLSDNDFVQLLDNVISHFYYVALEAPLKDKGQTWNNYLGTHILKIGWDEINNRMQEKGYKSYKYNSECYFYQKGNL